jgi:hypothetical protein
MLAIWFRLKAVANERERASQSHTPVMKEYARIFADCTPVVNPSFEKLLQVNDAPAGSARGLAKD